MPPRTTKQREYSRAYYLKNKRSILDRQNAWMKKWRKNNPEKYRAQKRRGNLRRQYGLTEKEYENIASSQGGACAICRGVSKKTLAVDHDHKTGKVRGLLCWKCNYALGLLTDNAEFLGRAIIYLRK